MSTITFYERAVALNRERHQKLKIEVTSNHYAFAAKTNALPIAGTEFEDVARHYPIVFIGDEPGSFNVAALLGLRDRENLFVNAQGEWDPETYVTAFARRYPFILADMEEPDRFAVCVDESYAGLNEKNGEALFDAAGKETPYMERLLGFLRTFHAEILRTRLFANRLAELGLLVPKVITVERAGQKQHLQGLWIVDSAKLNGIDDARVVELFRSGYLGWIQAHKLSLGNIARLSRRLDEHSTIAGDDALTEETLETA